MEVQKGDIVLSRNGRDKGKALFVLEVSEDYLLLVDGKSRTVEHPKRKKTKHCMFLDRESSRITPKLAAGEKVFNNEVRKALATFRAGNADLEQTDGEGN